MTLRPGCGRSPIPVRAAEASSGPIAPKAALELRAVSKAMALSDDAGQLRRPSIAPRRGGRDRRLRAPTSRARDRVWLDESWASDPEWLLVATAPASTSRRLGPALADGQARPSKAWPSACVHSVRFPCGATLGVVAPVLPAPLSLDESLGLVCVLFERSHGALHLPFLRLHRDQSSTNR